MSGKATVGEKEASWRFVPDSPFAAGKYRLVVDKVIEDLAGNAVDRPFEVETIRPAAPADKDKTVAVTFEIGKR